MNPATGGDPLRGRRKLLLQLNDAYAAGDHSGFEATLDRLLAERESVVMTGVQRLSSSLTLALAHFQDDSRIATLAARDIPDARQRLDHVLAMTEQAAHTTLDLIERSVPLADSSVQSARRLLASPGARSHEEITAFLDETLGNIEAVRHNLTEMMVTQGFQDLTGQILRGVKTLIGEVEDVLAGVAQLTGVDATEAPAVPATALEGPAVPGVTRNAVASQSDVDDLIAGLGI